MVYGQINDDFETGILSGWTEGVAGHWGVVTDGCINGSYSLHHVFDNASTGNDCVGLRLLNLHPGEGTTKWSFRIKHGYDPSASNCWAVYLMSDLDPGSFSNGLTVNGYAAGVNLAGYDDTLRLWKIRNGTITVVATCLLNWQTDIGTGTASKIIVERSQTGAWKISANDENNNLKGSGEGTDNELFDLSWLVLNYRYTSTRDRLLWFDDMLVEGCFYEDTSPPQVTGFNITAKNKIEVIFNEALTDEIPGPGSFLLGDASNQAVSVMRKAPAIIEIGFNGDFINKVENLLIIKNICDRYGNCDSEILIEFTPVWAEPADIIITEIMADPSPAVSLPEREYMEIMNTSAYPINLKKWSLGTETQKYSIPSIQLDPGEIRIVCSASDTLLFRKYGRIAGMKSFPGLTDEGKILRLSDSTGSFIHGVEYSSEWYGSQLKKDGGWSLEMIDTGYPFYAEGNWEASSSLKGGTPGTINSASARNPDLIFYGIENVFPEDSNSISISISESILSLSNSPDKIMIDGQPAHSVSENDLLLRKFIVRPDVPLKPGVINNISVNGDLKDFAGNEIIRSTFRFGLPEKPEAGDIVFNELLFNPLPDDPDFIEFYNCSDKVFDASRLWLTSIIPESGDTSELKPVSEMRRCILPSTFYCITTDRKSLLERYPDAGPENILEVSGLPSMPDNKGHLLLLDREMHVIDEVIYSEEMHYSLLASSEGVSLEKIRPGISSVLPSSWHSASESSGWGTPGKENSVFSPLMINNEMITLSSGRISPDNNGYEDVLVIDLISATPGAVITVTVFDEKGGFVRKLAENFLAGESASIVWDATADDGSLVSQGIYVILMELFDESGKTKSWKKVCSVIR
jgi:hypothetical protein